MKREGDPLLIVLGGGGHGRVICDTARTLGRGRVIVCDPDRREGSLEGYPFAREEEAEVLAHRPEDAEVIVALGGREPRRALILRLVEAGIPLATLCHPAATISTSARLAPGVVVLAGAVVNAGATVGIGSIVNTAAVVEHDCRIGRGVHVAPGSVICGGVTIGDWTDLGAGCVVIPGRTIGEAAVVGAGAVVVRDVAATDEVVGVPARSLLDRGSRDSHSPGTS